MVTEFDIERFEERAAIMEYDAGMTRFEAETAAAALQGVKRYEAINIIRNSQQGGDTRSQNERHAKNGLSRMQPVPKKEK